MDDFKQAAGERIKKEIASLRLKNTARWGRDDEFFIELPAAWLVFLQNRPVELKFYDDGGKRVDTVREESRGKGDAPGCVRLTFLFEADHIHDQDVKYVDVALPHPNFPATIRFNTAPIRDEGKTLVGDQTALRPESATVLEDKDNHEHCFRLLLK